MQDCPFWSAEWGRKWDNLHERMLRCVVMRGLLYAHLDF